MLGPVGETPFDLHFSLFGIPCRVHPGHWLIGVFMGWPYLKPFGPEYVIITVTCVFVSILVHELGHALTAYHSGYPVQIVLYHFGGLAIYQPSYGSRFAKPYTTWRAIWISFAGPGAGFVLYGIVVGIEALLKSGIVDVNVPLQIRFAIGQLKFMNLWWGVLNLFPVLPLDGGNICRELLVWKQGHRGNVTALKVGVVVGVLLAVGFLYLDRRFPAFFFGFMAFSNYQQYNGGGRRNPW